MLGPGDDDDDMEPGALRATDSSETSSRRGQVLVGSHLGSLYALPADDMLVDVAGTPPARWQQLQQQPAQAQDTLALPAGSDPEDVVGGEGGEPCPGGVCPPAEPCSQLVALSSSHDVATMDETELVCPLGLHIINESRVPRPYLPESVTRPPPVVQPQQQQQQQAPSGVAISAGPLPMHRLPVLIAIAAVVICALVVTVVVLVVKIRAQRGELPVLEEQPLLGADGQPAMLDQHHVRLQMASPGGGQPPGKGKGKGKNKRSKQAAADEAAGQDQELADARASVQASSSDASSWTAHSQKQQQDEQQDEQQEEMEHQRRRADSSVQEPSGPSSASAATDQANGTTAISKRSSESGTFLQDRAVVAPDGTVQIGRLKVGPGIVGYGSAGTIVYDGVLDGRPVAVKRLLRQFANLARKEIDVLIVSDEHPNVVRCFAMEEDREFVYVALERCKMTLSELITGPEPGGSSSSSSSAGVHKWGGEGPLPGLNVQGMQLISDMAAGLAALHARGIVHRDLKPHNVLLTESGRAKLSDMGLSKQLVAQQSSFESHGSGGRTGGMAVAGHAHVSVCADLVACGADLGLAESMYAVACAAVVQELGLHVQAGVRQSTKLQLLRILNTHASGSC
jgi:serine/threonine-protein kinase/endoribonuclease IRE1